MLSSRRRRQEYVAVNWLRLAIGSVILGLGMVVFLGMPLPMSHYQCMTYGLTQFAVSVSGMAAMAGVGVVMSAFSRR